MYWGNEEQTIIQLDYSDPVASWAEYDAANHKAYAMANSKNYEVIVFHNPGDVQMPQGGNPIMHLRNIIRSLPINVSLVVMHIANPFARQITASVMRLMHLRGARYRFAGSLEEASIIIATYK